tara:strand:- start:433 stop:615 length:183 start_codon:yes stop_codon:yes gene_type:complete
MNYNELSEIVNKSYRETGDIRKTVKEIQKIDRTITFNEVWEMIGNKDWFDFYETDEESPE